MIKFDYAVIALVTVAAPLWFPNQTGVAKFYFGRMGFHWHKKPLFGGLYGHLSSHYCKLFGRNIQ